MEAFSGSKVALICGDSVVAMQRGDVPGIDWANMWDLPGGGREGDETPEECAVREIEEELALNIPTSAFIWKREWPAIRDSTQKAWFFVAKISDKDVAAIRFGDEGQGWELMDIDEFMSRSDVIPAFKLRLKDYLAHRI